MFRIMTVILALSAFSPGLPGAAVAKEFDVGGWHGDAYYDKGSGEFTHCAISATYRSGDTLVFSITSDGEIVLGFSNTNWQFREGERYPVYLRIDRRNLGDYEAVANSPNAVYVFLPYSEDLIRLLRMGSVLYVEASRDTLRYKLTGTSAALPRVQDCVYREMFATQTARNPFSAGGGSARSNNPFGNRSSGGNPARSNGESGEDTVDTMLRLAGMTDYHFVPESSRPEFLSDAMYVWSNGDVLGSVLAHDMRGFDLGLITSVIVSAYEEACGGKFTYGIKPATFRSGTPARRVAAQCSTKSKETAMSFLTYQEDEFVMVIMHIGNRSHSEEVRAADEAIFSVFEGT